MYANERSALVFDAYGTLFDVSGLANTLSNDITQPEALVTTWRSTQLQYSFIRTITGRYADFLQVTRDALDFALDFHGQQVSESRRDRMVQRWLELPPFPEVSESLRVLSDFPRVILSNGTEAMLSDMLQNAGLASQVDLVLSADSVSRFKPDPSVYALAPAALGIPRDQILFVTANGFDIAGGKAAGFTVCRIDRLGSPQDRTGWVPDLTVENLSQLCEALEQEGRSEI